MKARSRVPVPLSKWVQGNVILTFTGAIDCLPFVLKVVISPQELCILRMLPHLVKDFGCALHVKLSMPRVSPGGVVRVGGITCDGKQALMFQALFA